jgi:hypothetical protein
MSEATTTKTSNPTCGVCLGTGIDAAFGSECSECWIDEGRAALVAAAYSGVRTTDADRAYTPGERLDGRTFGGSASNEASDKQLAFIDSLLAKVTDRNFVAMVEDALQSGVTKKQASSTIDNLKAVLATQADEAPAAPASVRPNKYGAKCAECGIYVEAETGSLTKENGRWITRHIGECPAAAPAPVEATDDRDGYEAKRGDVHVVDGTYYRIHESQRTGRAYAARATIFGEAEWGTDEDGKRILIQPATIDWDYAKGMIFKLNTETIATAAEAARFGEMVGRCCFCSHKIDTPESVDAGYGPTCASKYGLPWG